MAEETRVDIENQEEFNIWDKSVPVEKSAYLVEEAKFLNYENVNRIFALLKQADFHITRNANAKILFFDLTLQIGRQLSPNK